MTIAASDTLPSVLPPPWAVEFGEDRCGIFAEFEVDGVRFPMRWVPPGRFRMGSPETEEGRYDHEGPTHAVVLTRGYWIGITTVTQQQWKTLGSENLSRFQGDRRPVERVSWEDSQAWIGQLNDRIAGLSARLPTEAQWEYACRAGTASPFNGGAKTSLGQLGWYAKNSDRETHDVGAKEPNEWGLYDMHGNVWEWCLDGRRQYTAEAETDPVGPMQTGVDRAIRGGGWCYSAGSCRSAYRSASPPGDRYLSLGFRLVAGQETGPPEAASRGEDQGPR